MGSMTINPKGFNSNSEKIACKISNHLPARFVTESIPLAASLIICIIGSIMISNIGENLIQGLWNYLFLLSFTILLSMIFGLLVGMRHTGLLGGTVFILIFNIGVGLIETQLVKQGRLEKPDIRILAESEYFRLLAALAIVTCLSVGAYIILHSWLSYAFRAYQKNLMSCDFGGFAGDYKSGKNEVIQNPRALVEKHIRSLAPRYTDLHVRQYYKSINIRNTFRSLLSAIIAAVFYIAFLAWIGSVILNKPMVNLLDIMPLFAINICIMGYTIIFYTRNKRKDTGTTEIVIRREGLITALVGLFEPFLVVIPIYLLDMYAIPHVPILFQGVLTISASFLPLGALTYCIASWTHLKISKFTSRKVVCLWDEEDPSILEV